MKTKTQLLIEERDFLRAQVAQLQNYILMVAPNPQMNIASPRPSALSGSTADWVPQELHSTELEEDVMFQVEEGLITEDIAKAILDAAREADFEYDFNDE